MRTAESPSRDSPRSPNDKLPRIAASTVNAPQSKANLTVDFTARSPRPAFLLLCKTVATPIHYQCLLSEDLALHAKLIVEDLHSLFWSAEYSTFLHGLCRICVNAPPGHAGARQPTIMEITLNSGTIRRCGMLAGQRTGVTGTHTL